MSTSSGIRCLVVDDDKDDYFIAKEALADIQNRPHTAEWAHDYETAASLLRQDDYDVCLVDYSIGAHTGLEFIEDMIAAGCRVPMILLTGMSDPNIDEEAASAGAFDFIEKSNLEPRTLERAIRYSISLALQLRKLQDSSALLRVTLEHTGAGIAAFNNNKKLEAYNSQLLDLLSIDQNSADDFAEEISIGDVTDELETEVVEKLKLFSTEAQVDTEVTVDDGRTIEVCVNKAPDGRMIIVCSDITVRKSVQEELLRSREEAIAAAEAKTVFLANMSHELRTPLNAIIGFSDFLKIEMNKGQFQDKWLEYTKNIHESGIHLLSLINRILTLTKIDVGSSHLQEEIVRVRDIVMFCERNLSGLASTKLITVSSEICDDDLRVYCDEEVIRQALLNLWSNAIKFCNVGGHIKTVISRGETGDIRITVEDNGIGMSRAEIDKCLLPFVQADNRLARKYEGTGLGLPLVMRYLKLHDGTLELVSEKELGTAATIVLPVERVLQPQKAAATNFA